MALCEGCHLRMHHDDRPSMDISSITTDDSRNSSVNDKFVRKKIVRKIVKRKVAKKIIE